MQWPCDLIVHYLVKRQGFGQTFSRSIGGGNVWAVLLGEILSCCNEEFAQLYSQMGGLVSGLLVGVEGIFHSEMGVWEQDGVNS